MTGLVDRIGSVGRGIGGRGDRGIALIAVLMAMTLLLLLALPFALSMSRGAGVAVHAVEVRQAELGSQNARELVLANAAFGHPTYDETPSFDALDEYPDQLPEGFPGLDQDGRVRLGGELRDLQRYFALDAITPLMLSNLLGTTARLAATSAINLPRVSDPASSFSR